MSVIPAIVSVVEKINEPRYPSFKEIMAAKKKLPRPWISDLLALNPQKVGLKGSFSDVNKSEPVSAKNMESSLLTMVRRVLLY